MLMRGFHLHHYSYTRELFKHRSQCLELGTTFQSAYIFSLNVVLEELRLLTKSYSITVTPRVVPCVLMSLEISFFTFSAVFAAAYAVSYKKFGS